MAHTYMKFDFGSDEESAQQARHKLETWKQAFRLDKKLQYKLDRGEAVGAKDAAEEDADTEETGPPAGKSKGHAHAKPKTEAKGKGKTAEKSRKESADDSGGNVTLLVRLYFSSHEKLSEQRWFDRIPAEEPFKSASPTVIRQGDAEFEESEKHFADLG